MCGLSRRCEDEKCELSEESEGGKWGGGEGEEVKLGEVKLGEVKMSFQGRESIAERSKNGDRASLVSRLGGAVERTVRGENVVFC